MRATVRNLPRPARAAAAYQRAAEIADEDVETCRAIGTYGAKLIAAAAVRKKPGEPVNILTHCNAGWLACVDWGTATAPIYEAHDARHAAARVGGRDAPAQSGRRADRLRARRPRRSPHHRRRQRRRPPDAARSWSTSCIVGTDRVTANGDVANKIGTYLKALAAKDNGVPFYVALPHSTIDWTLAEGKDIPIEERGADEVLVMRGRTKDGGDRRRRDRRPRQPRAQRRLRRHPRTPRHRPHHRARRLRRLARGPALPLPRAPSAVGGE